MAYVLSVTLIISLRLLGGFLRIGSDQRIAVRVYLDSVSMISVRLLCDSTERCIVVVSRPRYEINHRSGRYLDNLSFVWSITRKADCANSLPSCRVVITESAPTFSYMGICQIACLGFSTWFYAEAEKRLAPTTVPDKRGKFGVARETVAQLSHYRFLRGSTSQHKDIVESVVMF